MCDYIKVEAYSVEEEGCPLICRFATMGAVRSIKHSKIGNKTFPGLASDSLHLHLFYVLAQDKWFAGLFHQYHHVCTPLLSHPGDYLVTIEEKNNATYLRAYTNWRYQVQIDRFDSSVFIQSCVHYFTQAEEKARVGVRLLGHLLRGASLRSGVQTEIIEIPLSECPVAVACCPVSGDLLVACENTLVLFTLRRQNQQSLVKIHLLMSSSN